MELIIKDTDELSAAQLIAIMRERVKVFVVEQHCPYQEVDGKDFEARHVMLQSEGHLVAYSRIVPHDDGIHMSLGRVIVVREFRGQEIGRRIVGEGLAEIRRLYPNTGIKIAGQNRLRKFYVSFGFVPVSDVYLEDGIPHVDMVLES